MATEWDGLDPRAMPSNPLNDKLDLQYVSVMSRLKRRSISAVLPTPKSSSSMNAFRRSSLASSTGSGLRKQCRFSITSEHRSSVSTEPQDSASSMTASFRRFNSFASSEGDSPLSPCTFAARLSISDHPIDDNLATIARRSSIPDPPSFLPKAPSGSPTRPTGRTTSPLESVSPVVNTRSPTSSDPLLKNPRVTMLVVGSPMVGKTQLIRSFVGEDFQPNYVSSTKAEVHETTKEVPAYLCRQSKALSEDDDLSLEVRLWDIPGRASKYAMRKAYKAAGTVHAVMLCYSSTDKSSLEDVKMWINMIKDARLAAMKDANAADHPPIHFALIETKSDVLLTRTVERGEGEALAKELGCPLYVSNAKDPNNATEVTLTVASDVSSVGNMLMARLQKQKIEKMAFAALATSNAPPDLLPQIRRASVSPRAMSRPLHEDHPIDPTDD